MKISLNHSRNFCLALQLFIFCDFNIFPCLHRKLKLKNRHGHIFHPYIGTVIRQGVHIDIRHGKFIAIAPLAGNFICKSISFHWYHCVSYWWCLARLFSCRSVLPLPCCGRSIMLLQRQSPIHLWPSEVGWICVANWKSNVIAALTALLAHCYFHFNWYFSFVQLN